MPQSNSAFTLSELLIALALLGLIASFTIPKVLQTTSNSSRNSIFKETIAAVSEIIANAHLNPDLGPMSPTTIRDYFDQRLNYVRRCTSSPRDNGCFPDDGSIHSNQGYAYVLHNGLMLTSVNGGTYGGNTLSDWMTLDYNGLAGPNQIGEDQVGICVNYFDNTEPGRVVAHGDATNRAFFNSIFE